MYARWTNDRTLTVDVARWPRPVEAGAVLGEFVLCTLGGTAAVAFLGGARPTALAVGVVVGLVLGGILYFTASPGARWRLPRWERTALVLGMSLVIAVVLITHEQPGAGTAVAFGSLALGAVLALGRH